MTKKWLKKSEMSIFMQKKYYINLLAIVFLYKKSNPVNRSISFCWRLEGRKDSCAIYEEVSSNSSKKIHRILLRSFVGTLSWPSKLQWNWIVYIWLWNLWPSCIRCTIYSLPKFLNVIWCEMFFLAKGFFKKYRKKWSFCQKDRCWENAPGCLTTIFTDWLRVRVSLEVHGS